MHSDFLIDDDSMVVYTSENSYIWNRFLVRAVYKIPLTSGVILFDIAVPIIRISVFTFSNIEFFNSLSSVLKDLIET
jgi:hypothetical protein